MVHLKIQAVGVVFPRVLHLAAGKGRNRLSLLSANIYPAMEKGLIQNRVLPVSICGGEPAHYWRDCLQSTQRQPVHGIIFRQRLAAVVGVCDYRPRCRDRRRLLGRGGGLLRLEPFQAHAFDGGAATESQGRGRDFNLMLRKGKCRGELRPLRFPEAGEASIPLPAPADVPS